MNGYDADALLRYLAALNEPLPKHTLTLHENVCDVPHCKAPAVHHYKDGGSQRCDEHTLDKHPQKHGRALK